jgi:hypothetical protein
MQVWEVVNSKRKPSTPPVQGKVGKRGEPTEFEKNVSKLRSKERKLNPQSPVAPIKHRA